MEEDSALPGHGFGVPDIYLAEGEKDEDVTVCFSTVTETMGKILVRTRSWGFMSPYIYMYVCVCVCVCVCMYVYMYTYPYIYT